ncbi:MAG TPA: AMP-binding protein, partial [Polyangiaceae bacterium]
MGAVVAANNPEHRRGFYDSATREVVWFTYRELLGRSFALAERLREQGVAQGDYCLLLGMSPYAQVTSLYAALSLGAIPMFLAPPKALAAQGARVADSVVRWMSRLEQSWLLSDPEACASLGPLLADPARICQVPPANTLSAFELRPAPEIRPLDGSSISHLQATSASTGDAKAARISHGNVLANVSAIRAASHMRERELVCSWLPLNHDMGLIGTELLSLCHAYSLISLSAFDFVKRPLAWLKLISEHRCSLSTAPNFAYEYAALQVSAAEAERLDLSCWKVAFNGAEPIRRRSLRSFLERFEVAGFDARTMRPCYGLAEATLAVTVADRE